MEQHGRYADRCGTSAKVSFRDSCFGESDKRGQALKHYPLTQVIGSTSATFESPVEKLN